MDPGFVGTSYGHPSGANGQRLSACLARRKASRNSSFESWSIVDASNTVAWPPAAVNSALAELEVLPCLGAVGECVDRVLDGNGAQPLQPSPRSSFERPPAVGS